VRGARILGEHGLHRTRALRGGLDAWIEIEAATPLGDAQIAEAGLNAGCAR
jgi:hypothetical protein